MNKIKPAFFLSKASFPTRVIVLLMLGFFAKLFFSCTPPPPTEMYFNAIEIYGVNNSGIFLISNTRVDTMYSEAVAFKLVLFDSAFSFCSSNIYKAIRNLLFTPAMALSFDDVFIPVNKVEQIKITTLFDIDENIKAGSDITNSVLFERNNNFELYQDINSAISTLNNPQPISNSSIVFVLTVPTINSKLQLNVQATLDNGTVLSANTNIITILNPKE